MRIMRTFDLGYWDGEKSCSICNMCNHYTVDCPEFNQPMKYFLATCNGSPIAVVEAMLFEGRAEHEAWGRACDAISKADRKWYDENWGKIKMIRMYGA